MAGFDSLPRAVAGAAGVAHYGEPAQEQRALERGTAVADLADRAVLALTGPDRRTWLESIASQALSRLDVRESSELLILDPQGRVEHAAAFVDDGETSWLIVDADDAAPLAGFLLRMRFRAQVDIAARDDLRVLGYSGSGSASRLVEAAAPLAVWHDPWARIAVGGHQYSHAAPHPGEDRDWNEAIVTAPAARTVAHSIGSDVRAAGLLAAEALRIAAWRPRWARERDERTIPHEVDWIRSAVHLEKGCYRGQETVAKVHNLGHPPRRLVMLHLDGSDSILPEPGAPVRAGDREVGAVTSVGVHHELGPVALALVMRRVPADAVLTVAAGDDGEVAASQEIVVPADAGATADVPKLTRLSRRPQRQD